MNEVIEPAEIFRRIIVIRPLTTLKPAMELMITQRIANTGEIAMPTLTYRGEYPNNITSWRFCRDFAFGWMHASYVMLERTMYVRGMK